MSLAVLRNSTEWALMVALVFGVGAIAQAQDSSADGRIVQIGPADSGNVADSAKSPTDGAITPVPGTIEQAPLPKHWIGILGGPVPDYVRAQVDIPDDYGVMIREVVPDSPAAKAGLTKYDIVLRANDTDVSDMRDLANLVTSEGEQGGKISMEVLRRGQRETIVVTPEERPENVALSPPEGTGAGWGMPGQPGDFQQFFNQHLPSGQPFAFRSFGPGMQLNFPGAGTAGMPNGVSVSVSKENDQPAKVTVKRGEDTWEFNGDDPEALKQLPEDLRPFVSQFLGQNVLGGHATGTFVPNVTIPQLPELQNLGPDLERMQQQLQQMEKQMQDLSQRMNGAAQSDSNSGQ
jgi:membrane-associated protease RseP (regulator of RpoE activity)